MKQEYGRMTLRRPGPALPCATRQMEYLLPSKSNGKTEEDVLQLLLGICALIASIGAGLSDESLEIKSGYLREAPSRIRISPIEGPAGNIRFAGAQQATEDNNAIGILLHQRSTLIDKPAAGSDH